MKIRNSPERNQAVKEGNFVFPTWIADLGWARALTTDLFLYFAIVCAVATQDLKGEEMWSMIADIASRQRRSKPDKNERAKAKRLEKQYGRRVPSPSDVRGNIEYLIAVGLVVQEMHNGKEILDLPENPAKPTAFLLGPMK